MSAIVVGPADLHRMNEAVSSSSHLAVDTEFHAEQRYTPRLLLVQVHTASGDTWIVDPLVEGLLPALAPALLSRPWIVHAGHQDLRLLQRVLGGVPEVVLDTQIAAGLVGPDYPSSFRQLVDEHLGITLAKSSTLSDWSQRPLTADQLSYAVNDVRLLPPLWAALELKIAARGRETIVRAAVTEARDLAIGPQDTSRLWRDIPATAYLTPEQAAIAQDLAAWRERLAEERDQPARSVLSDGLLVDLARRGPTSPGALYQNRRFPASVAKRYGESLLAVIHEAGRRPASSWPQPLRAGTVAQQRASWIELLGSIAGNAGNWGARLVLPRTLSEDIALLETPDEAHVSGILGPWRTPLVGDLVARGLRGELALRVLDGNPCLQAV